MSILVLLLYSYSHRHREQLALSSLEQRFGNDSAKLPIQFGLILPQLHRHRHRIRVSALRLNLDFRTARFEF